MTTIILGLGALTIVMGYVVRVKDKRIEKLKIEVKTKDFAFETLKADYSFQLDREKENWKQTTNSWILEKEEIIDRLTNQLFSRGKEHLEFKFESDKKIKELEREQFNQLHELALMLNDSYYVDEIILEKAEKFDWLVNDASREQKRNFIKGYIIK